MHVFWRDEGGRGGEEEEKEGNICLWLYVCRLLVCNERAFRLIRVKGKASYAKN